MQDEKDRFWSKVAVTSEGSDLCGSGMSRTIRFRIVGHRDQSGHPPFPQVSDGDQLGHRDQTQASDGATHAATAEVHGGRGSTLENPSSEWKREAN